MKERINKKNAGLAGNHQKAAAESIRQTLSDGGMKQGVKITEGYDEN
jgi:hypothetical protein